MDFLHKRGQLFEMQVKGFGFLRQICGKFPYGIG